MSAALITEKQLAERLGISVRTLQSDRQRGGGIPFQKNGRNVRYDRNAVVVYLKSRNSTPTVETKKRGVK